MNEPAIPKYQWGQRVRAVSDLLNDGSFPDQPADVLLARTGDVGEIVQVGRHVEANVAVYLVEFGERCIVGCLEEEIELSHEQARADHARKDDNE